MLKHLFRAGLALSMFLAALVMPDCYYDNEQSLYGEGGGCDTTSISYSQDIVPILDDQCYGCHDAASFTVSGSQFDTYDLLQPYSGIDGSLLLRINDVDSPMPPNGLMDDCLRSKIEAWVKAGAPNN